MPTTFVEIKGLRRKQSETWARFRLPYSGTSESQADFEGYDADTYDAVMKDLVRLEAAVVLEDNQLDIQQNWAKEVRGPHCQTTGNAADWAAGYIHDAAERECLAGTLGEDSFFRALQASYSELRLPYMTEDGRVARLYLQRRKPLLEQLDGSRVYVPEMLAISLVTYPKDKPASGDAAFHSFSDGEFRLFLDSDTWEDSRHAENSPDMSSAMMSREGMIEVFKSRDESNLSISQTAGIAGHSEINRLLCLLAGDPEYIDNIAACLRLSAAENPLSVAAGFPICSSKMLKESVDALQQCIREEKRVSPETPVKTANGRWRFSDGTEAIDFRDYLKDLVEAQKRKKEQEDQEEQQFDADEAQAQRVRRLKIGGGIFAFVLGAAIIVSRVLDFIPVFSGLLGAAMGGVVIAATLKFMYGNTRVKVAILAVPLVIMAGILAASSSIEEMFQAFGVMDLALFSPIMIGFVSGATVALIVMVVYAHYHIEDLVGPVIVSPVAGGMNIYDPSGPLPPSSSLVSVAAEGASFLAVAEKDLREPSNDVGQLPSHASSDTQVAGRGVRA